MSWLSFIMEYLRNPRKVGAVAPSSPALVSAMLRPIDWKRAKTIVEFGPGTGVMTQGALARMRPDATLVAYEIHETFYRKMSRIKDPRFEVRKQSAELLDFKADAIISSLPLLAMPHDVRKNILHNAAARLNKDGVFMQFQYASTLEPVLKRFFPLVKRVWVPNNLPPAFAYECRANARSQTKK